MSDSLLFCVEMDLPPELQGEAMQRALSEYPHNAASSSGDYTRFWQPGTALHVRFMDGDRGLQERVASVAHEWSQRAYVGLLFDADPGAQIRVTFSRPLLWCYKGTDSLVVSASEPTMCLGVLTADTDEDTFRAVVLHAFGHALGLVHGHQNPPAGIPWDKPRVYAYMALGYGWSAAQVDADVFARYSSSTQFQMFDCSSIMQLAIPKDLCTGGFEVGWNIRLSESDLEFVRQVYPHPMSHSKPFSMAVTAGEEPVEEHIRLDVHRPETVRVGEAFDLAVAVRQPDAPVLRLDDLTKVVSEEGTVFRPGDQSVIKYRIEVTGAECTITPPHYLVMLHKGENARPCYFQVTVNKPGKRSILISAYQEDESLAAQTRVLIEVQLAVQEPALDKEHVSSPVAEDAQMNFVLTPRETEEFKEALLSAFRRGALEQVVYFNLEERLDDIVQSGTYDNEVGDLVIWANDNNKVGALLEGARRKNKGNAKLREFDEYLQAKIAGQVEPAAAFDPLKGQKGALVDQLCNLPVAETHLGRTSLLDGIPGSDTLARDEGNKRLDLELIVTGLAKRGRLAGGQAPVAKLIDNALPYARGYEAEGKLRDIQLKLA